MLDTDKFRFIYIGVRNDHLVLRHTLRTIGKRPYFLDIQRLCRSMIRIGQRHLVGEVAPGVVGSIRINFMVELDFLAIDEAVTCHCLVERIPARVKRIRSDNLPADFAY
jgi:hypothetical protein